MTQNAPALCCMYGAGIVLFFIVLLKGRGCSPGKRKSPEESVPADVSGVLGDLSQAIQDGGEYKGADTRQSGTESTG